MNILICSKYKNRPEWTAIKSILVKNGHSVVTPADIDHELHGHLNAEEDIREYLESVKRFHEEIMKSDLIYVLNFEGEFGKSMMLEIGYASALGKRIVALESLDNEPSLELFIKEIKKPEEI